MDEIEAACSIYLGKAERKKGKWPLVNTDCTTSVLDGVH